MSNTLDVKYEKQAYQGFNQLLLESNLVEADNIELTVVQIPLQSDLLYISNIWWEVTLDDLLRLRFRESCLMEIEVFNAFSYIPNEYQTTGSVSSVKDFYKKRLRALNSIEMFQEDAPAILLRLKRHLVEYMDERGTRQKRKNLPFSVNISRKKCPTCDGSRLFILSETSLCPECS